MRNASLGDFVVVRVSPSALTQTQRVQYSLLLLGYKPVQHVTVLNTVGNCNTMVLYCYNLMEPPSYRRSVVDRNVVMRRIPVSTLCCSVNKKINIRHYPLLKLLAN